MTFVLGVVTIFGRIEPPDVQYARAASEAFVRADEDFVLIRVDTSRVKYDGYKIMTAEDRAQLVEDIERSANMRRGIAEQARLGADFDIEAAWEGVEKLDASINARIKKARSSANNEERLS